MNTYEAMFILDSAKTAVSWDDAVQQVHDVLTKHEAEIVATRHWDERRLAYAVEGQKKGTYLLTFFRADGSKLNDIEAAYRLSDLVVRDLILRIHPKLVESRVSQAMVQSPNGEDGDAPREEEHDDRPRRRRRDD
ncbi:MAG: 30S ribosomal protein S6 [Isosphaeraceae bacterium]